MNLSVARVGHVGAAFVSPEGGHDIAAHGVGGEVEDVAVSAGGKDDGISSVGSDFTSDEVTNNNAFGVPIDNNNIEHLGASVHFDAAFGDFFGKRLIATDEELLTGLAAGVEGAFYLGAAERTVVEKSAIFPGEGDTLGNALIDDLVRDFGEAMHVGFAGAEVAAFDGVVEEPEDGVAVVLVILGSVDSALGGD